MPDTETQELAPSATYMALVLSKEGDIVPNIKKLWSQVMHLEPTLSYAIAWAGYEQCNALLIRSLQDARQRLLAREEAILLAPKPVAREVWQLRDDVVRLGELLEAAVAARNNLKKNKLQLEWDIHMSVVDLVRVMWELDGYEF
ncbi:hypothetical protein MBLNU13_g06825t1 [Cladosporium sp. NU13]